MNGKVLILLATLLTAALIFFLLPSDEKKIRNILQQLAEFCSSSPDTNSIATLTQVHRATKLCTKSCAVEVESFDIKQQFTRKDLSDNILMMKKMLPDTRFTFNDIQINFPDENSAQLTTTLSLQGKTENQRFTDAYELDISVLKTDGDWLFSSFTIVEFMER